MKVTLNFLKLREALQKDLYKDIEKSNTLWEDVIKLIITLSSSFLLLTLALAQKLFPSIEQNGDLPFFLTLAWILLFLSIIFGIITEINEIIFHGNIGRKNIKDLQECDKKISQGKIREEIDLPGDYIINNSIIWGVICVNSFIISVLCLSLSLFEKISSTNICYIVFTITLLLLFLLNYHLTKKRLT